MKTKIDIDHKFEYPDKGYIKTEILVLIGSAMLLAFGIVAGAGWLLIEFIKWAKENRF